MTRASSFTFGSYEVDPIHSVITFTYRVELRPGTERTYTDRLYLSGIPPEAWDAVPKTVLEPTLQALLLMFGINYWTVFPTKNMRIEGFSLTREQAQFWNALYLHGLGEYFYDMKMDFEGLIAFPFAEGLEAPAPTNFPRPARALLLNGAGKDSILTAELLKEKGLPFDFFAFAPSPAHERIATLVGAKTVSVKRRRDRRVNLIAGLNFVSAAYPSVSTFTFVAVLLAELLGYDAIIFSNERSADSGNLIYKGLNVNHQWCKSSEAEKLINTYLERFITPSITTKSLLRQWSELEIVERFARYPQYLPYVTSCNSYFWLPWPMQHLIKKGYWCKECPKCVFLFACFAAYLPKHEMKRMFGGNLYERRHLLPLIRRILGVEGFKPLDCVGEPEEMILAMHYASQRGEYRGSPALRTFEKRFPADYPFAALESKMFTRT